MSLWKIDIRSGIAKARVAVGLLQAFALLAINGLCSGTYYGSVMFTSPRLNFLAVDAMLTLPALSLILLGMAISSRRSQPPLTAPRPLLAARCGVVTLVPVCAICLLMLTLTLNDPPKSEKEVFESSPSFVQNVPVGGPPVRLYKRDGPEWGYFFLQQERPILPGLLWVTQLWEVDREGDPDSNTENANDSFTTEVLDRHHLRCTYHPDNHQGHNHTVVVENP